MPRELDGRAEVAIVLAGLRGDRSVKEVCREHAISDTLYYSSPLASSASKN